MWLFSPPGQIMSFQADRRGAFRFGERGKNRCGSKTLCIGICGVCAVRMTRGESEREKELGNSKEVR